MTPFGRHKTNVETAGRDKDETCAANPSSGTTLSAGARQHRWSPRGPTRNNLQTLSAPGEGKPPRDWLRLFQGGALLRASRVGTGGLQELVAVIRGRTYQGASDAHPYAGAFEPLITPANARADGARVAPRGIPSNLDRPSSKESHQETGCGYSKVVRC